MTVTLTETKTTTQVLDEARARIGAHINELSPSLRTEVNKVLHDNPELGYNEVIAHDTLTFYLEKHGFTVIKGAYGLSTSFEATLDSGKGGRLVVFCAEYDALPGIGHACGHNLVATSSLAAFISSARAIVDLGIAGRVRILGTPAEEGGGGKVKLIEAGAFNEPGGIDAAVMVHPMAAESLGFSNRNPKMDYAGLAGMESIASQKLRVEFRGRTAHAAVNPWDGANALDAAVAAYNNVSMLRQHIRPDERIHGVFEDGGAAPNVIPEYTRMHWCIRSPTVKRSEVLLKRVKACFEAGAAASGCEVNYIPSPTYKDLIPIDTLCTTYAEEMSHQGLAFQPRQMKPSALGSTDMGNVSHLVPSLHGLFAIPVSQSGVSCHNPGFAAAAATDEAHEITMKCAKGLAMLALRVLLDEDVAAGMKLDFQNSLA